MPHMVRDMAVTAFTIKKLSLSTMQSPQCHPVAMVSLSTIMLGHPSQPVSTAVSMMVQGSL